MTEQPGAGLPPAETAQPGGPAAASAAQSTPAPVYAGDPGAYPSASPGHPAGPATQPSPGIGPPGQFGPGSYPPVPPPPPEGRWKPARVDPVPGTDFGLVQLAIAPAASGLATGALLAGIGSILASTLVLCFGVAGAAGGWGGWVAGAFTLLAVLVGGGAVAIGLVARRQIARSGGPGRLRLTGRGVAVAGISCGAVGVGIALLGLALGLVLQL